jgi:aerobic C4-dicarboxylate transport protein
VRAPGRSPRPPALARRALLPRNLTVRVLLAISAGVALGILAPDTAKAMKPLGDTFVNLVKMVVGPIVFLTIVLGIANMADLKKVGRVGGKAFLYFEVVTTFALAIGLTVVNVTKPGRGARRLGDGAGDVSRYARRRKQMNWVDFLTHVVPSSVVDAFARATCCRSSSSRCCSASRWPGSARAGARSRTCSSGWPT